MRWLCALVLLAASTIPGGAFLSGNLDGRARFCTANPFPQKPTASTFFGRRVTVLRVTLDQQQERLQSQPDNATEAENVSDSPTRHEKLDTNDGLATHTGLGKEQARITVPEATVESFTELASRDNDDDDDQFSISNDDDNSNNNILGMAPNAILALNTVAIIWGSQHAVIKMVVDDAQAGPFTLLRFAIGAMIATVPILFQANGNGSSSSNTDNLQLEEQHYQSQLLLSSPQYKNKIDDEAMTVLRWGVEMGFWMFLGFAFQAVGLATTTAQRSGFLLYLNVKFVPFFAFILFGKHISLPTWISALTAFCGTALLAYDGTSSFSLNAGDVWSIAAAAASAMYILRLDTAANAVGDNNSVKLNAACLWMVTFLSAIWSIGGVVMAKTDSDASFLLLGPQLMHILTSHPWELFYLSAVTTALANYIQTLSKKQVSAERASVIYAMDPVYGAAFSNILLGESLTSLGFVGAGLITAAAATNAFLDLGERDEAANSDEGDDRKAHDKSQ